MLTRTGFIAFLSLAGGLLLAGEAAADDTAAAKLATYDSPAGETFFALSLKPDAAVPPAAGHDILVLFDTSASQTGVYRNDALAALKTMLSVLALQDRVHLMAVDLKAVDMTGGFVAANSDAMKAGLEKLKTRAPLGSTDMVAGLHTAIDRFADAGKRSRAVIYIGDGMSRANLLQSREFAALAQRCEDGRVPVSSFAIGPGRDVELLAALANHTGGMVYVDALQGGTAEQAGLALADVAKATVFWPVQSKLPSALREVFPVDVPPLRSDRDTVLIGTLEQRGQQPISIQAEANGETVDLAWQPTSEPSSEDLNFLPNIVETARKNSGIGLPTVGWAGLREVGRFASSGADQLADLGTRALRTGDIDGALNVADAILERDPNHPQAQAIRNAARQRMAGRAGDDAELRLVLQPAPDAPPAGGQQPGGMLNDFMLGDEGQFLDLVQSSAEVISQKLQAEVERELSEARSQMATNPEAAKEELKLLLETIERTTDLEPQVRAQLRDQIESAIRESQRRGYEVAELRAQAEERRAQAEEAQRIIAETQRQRQTVKQLMARFNMLMEEGRYRDAEDVIAEEVRALDPISTTPVAAVWEARFGGAVAEAWRLREVRHKNFYRAMQTVERALVPFPDDPPISYPEPEVWADLTLRRKKYASIDLARRGGAEEKIFNALNDDTRLEFIESPLEDVVAFLRDQHEIPIEIDTKALDDIGLGTDVPITRNLKGISLRSALRLMLKDLELTYVVRDEVLLITTPEEAESQLVTKVYPVGDLVLPISAGGGINPFQMGGGGGGGMGGGMGGGGMGGGGMGGGGMGGGGGGGFFAVEDFIAPRNQ